MDDESDSTTYVRPDGDRWDGDVETGRIIEFVCKEEDYGKIPEPIPANSVIPDWYEEMEESFEYEDEEQTREVKTVTKCMPFLDAMTMGWILPLADDLHVTTNEDGETEFYSSFHKQLVHTQPAEQFGPVTSMVEEDTIVQFRGFWWAVAPEGYSIVITSPLNRFESRFRPTSGVVDVDSFLTGLNSVVLWEEGSYEGTIEKGTPVVQVIPFERDAILSDAVTRPFSSEEEERIEQQKAEWKDAYYRKDHWHPKQGRGTSPSSSSPGGFRADPQRVRDRGRIPRRWATGPEAVLTGGGPVAA